MGIIPSSLRLKIAAHCPTLIRAKSVYSTLIKSCPLNRLTYLTASSLALSPQGARVNRALSGQCVTPCGGENNVRTHDWPSWTGTRMWWQLQITLTVPHCMCMARWMHVCSNHVSNVLCPLPLVIVPPPPRSRMRDYKRSQPYSNNILTSHSKSLQSSLS